MSRYVQSLITLDRSNATFTPEQGLIRIPLDSVKFAIGTEVCLARCSIPVSWHNISTAQGNNTFSYRINATVFPVFMPDSTYSLLPAGQGNSIDAYLQYVMKLNGHYLIDNTGTERYYLSIVANLSSYRVTVGFTVVPAVLPVGWSDPAGFIAAFANFAPQLVTDASDFNVVIGSAKNTTYPVTNNVSGSIDLPNVPDVSTISVLNFSCNMISNHFVNNQYLYSEPASASFGSYQIIQPNFELWQQIVDQRYSEIVIQLIDAKNRPIVYQDTDISLSLFIRYPTSDRSA